MYTRLVLCGLVAAALFVSVNGHAWMSDPAGRSGGTISGASTSSTCNPGKSARSVASGATIPVTAQRANGHGNTLTATVYTCDASTSSAAATCTSNAIGTTGWTARTSANLDTSVASPQSVNSVTALSANFIIGTKLAFSATDVWYDCALITVAAASGGGAAGSCSTNNGGCDINGASCDGSSGSIQCTCKFPSYYGNGIVCAPVIDNQYIRMRLTLSGNQCGDSSLQNQVTQAVASVANVPTSIINYDICTADGTGNSIVWFSISPDRYTGAKNYDAQFAIQSAVAGGNNFLSGRTVIAAAAGDSTAVTSSGPANKGWIAAAVLVPLFVLAAIGGGYWYYKKREREGRPITNPCAGALTKSTTGKSDKTYAGSTPVSTSTGAAASSSTTRYGNTTASSSGNTTAPLPASRPQVGAWTAEKDGQGHIYYFNHQTGESTWERPAGVFIPPPK